MTHGLDLRIASDPSRLFRVPGGAVAALLAALGDALDHDARPPTLPVWPPARISAERGDALMEAAPLIARGYPAPIEPPPSAEELAALRDYEAALRCVLEAPGPDLRRVPAFKLTPSGYLVRPKEAAIVSLALRDAADPLLVSLCAYTSDASALGGFFVR